MDLLERLLGHDRWATARFLELSRPLTDAQLDQDFDIGHRTLRATWTHVIYTIDFWSKLMTGRPAGYREYPPGLSIEALADAHARFHEIFSGIARRLQDEQRLDETFTDHFGYPQSIGGTIVQVVLHNALHRSEAQHILQRLGIRDLPDGDPQEWEHVAGLIATLTRPER